MSKQIVIAEQHRIAAVFSEDQIQELIVAQGTHQVSDIYLGIVENVLPGIDAAFVNIGDSERNGFIHVSDLGPLKLRRTSSSITELLMPQQKVLVQVMKEPTGNKGPRLTGNVTLPGRYLVLMPYGRGVNLSRRIRNENERNRLRALAILVKPHGMGLLVRTEAEEMPEEAIIEDLEALQRQWEEVLEEVNVTRAPALLNRDEDFILRVLRDVYSSDVNRIVADSHIGLKRVKQNLLSWNSGKLPSGVLIDQHRDRIPLLEYFRVNAAIKEALSPRVDLPSGGYIIIERTEALTVIDVNSGSFTKSATARETVLWTNCESATEIARQLRLRNIAGVIVVDFIDMESRRDQLQVLEHFNKALRADKARPQIAQLTELGLVELTRKRQGKNIYELFGRPCPHCGGLGHLVHLPDQAIETDGNAVERSTSAALRESRETIWEDRSESADEEVDSIVLPHPNYQEVGGRRRRRRREDAPVSNGAAGFPVPTNRIELAPDAEPYPVGEEGVPLPRVGRERGRRGARRGRDLPEAVNDFGGGSAIAPPPLETNREPPPLEVEERRGRSRREKPPAEPQEVVTVEMDADEQEIYAWMGISPLILATEEVKNPRSAIVSVVLPGEAPPKELATIAEIAIAAAPPSTTLVLKTKNLEPQMVTEVAAPVEINPPLPAELPTNELGADEPADDESNESEESAVNRRRRRRSSATANE